MSRISPRRAARARPRSDRSTGDDRADHSGFSGIRASATLAGAGCCSDLGASGTRLLHFPKRASWAPMPRAQILAGRTFRRQTRKFAFCGRRLGRQPSFTREAASVSGLFHRKELRQPTVRCRRWHFSDMARCLAQIRNSHARRKTRLWFVSHGDSVRGPERRPRQRSGFGEENPAEAIGQKRETAIRRPGRSHNADSRARWRRAHIRSSRRPAGPRRRLAS
jgi:hypothetical protein